MVDDEEGALCEGDPCREGEDDIGDPARRSAVEDLTTEWVAEPLRPHPTRLAAERKKGNEVPDPRLLDLDSVSDEVGPLAAVEEDGLNPGGCHLLQEEDPCQGVVEPVPDRPKEGDPLRVHGEGAVEGELEVGDVLLPRVDLDLDPFSSISRPASSERESKSPTTRSTERPSRRATSYPPSAAMT